MSIINTNVMSLNSQRNLAANNASLGTTIQRLSSGLRINSAKDDAAGLAISERFTTQIRGLNQAARNANDGISLSQTAEGALAEIGNNLQRVRELAVQSSNATNSSTDRDALQAEVTQLQAEIQRVASQTEFNGTKLLDGNFAGQAFQVGANAGQLITVDSIASAQTDSLGATQFADGTVTIAVPTSAAADMVLTDVTVNNVNLGTFTIAANSGTAAEMQQAMQTAVVSAINANSAEIGAVAKADGTTAGQINITGVTDTSTQLTFTSTQTNTGAPTLVAAALATEYVADVDISDFNGAQRAIGVMDQALTAVNSSRAELGAIQNRFSSVISNLNTTSENLSASRSRIRDTDFAKETAELTRSQILNQAGTAMLAQANQVPQSVLSLLR
ncbi:flagellin [Thermomonas sp.]|jgi:flagellin|uniref:flagellin n=1 Tax=Thermomonas sp. TaxID=1971895 RepID=UPI00257DE3CD|nr:flagellin [Thermomonas sp.]